jgi:hypothetical protein
VIQARVDVSAEPAGSPPRRSPPPGLRAAVLGRARRRRLPVHPRATPAWASRSPASSTARGESLEFPCTARWPVAPSSRLPWHQLPWRIPILRTTSRRCCGRCSATTARRSMRRSLGPRAATSTSRSTSASSSTSGFISHRPPVGEEGPNDDLNVRGLQGFDEEDLVTCRYTTPSGNSVTAIGFFTGQG